MGSSIVILSSACSLTVAQDSVDYAALLDASTQHRQRHYQESFNHKRQYSRVESDIHLGLRKRAEAAEMLKPGDLVAFGG